MAAHPKKKKTSHKATKPVKVVEPVNIKAFMIMSNMKSNAISIPLGGFFMISTKEQHELSSTIDQAIHEARTECAPPPPPTH